MDKFFIRKGMVDTAVIAARFVIQIGRREAGLRFLEPKGRMVYV